MNRRLVADKNHYDRCASACKKKVYELEEDARRFVAEFLEEFNTRHAEISEGRGVASRWDEKRQELAHYELKLKNYQMLANNAPEFFDWKLVTVAVVLETLEFGRSGTPMEYIRDALGLNHVDFYPEYESGDLNDGDRARLKSIGETILRKMEVEQFWKRDEGFTDSDLVTDANLGFTDHFTKMAEEGQYVSANFPTRRILHSKKRSYNKIRHLVLLYLDVPGTTELGWYEHEVAASTPASSRKK